MAAQEHLKMVHGVVRDPFGPVAGALVRVMDQDSLVGGRDDEIGRAVTGADGRYSVVFRKAVWDPPKSRHHTGWRPDVYIETEWGGGFKQREPVRGNTRMHDMRQDRGGLEWNVHLRSLFADTSLRPSTHCFRFVNSFDVSLFGHRVGGFGLCGGMSRYALDLYQNRLPVPLTTVTPQRGALFDTLYDRQVRTLLPDAWSEFIVYQALPIKDTRLFGKTLLRGLGHVTRGSWQVLKRNLDEGRPTVLGLIRQGPLKADFPWQNLAHLAPWKNHQVLAYRYAELKSDGVKIWIYDPNHPMDDDVVIELDLSDHDTNDLHCQQYRTVNGQKVHDPLRGFFVNFAYDQPRGPGDTQQTQEECDGRSAGSYRYWAGDFDGDGYRDFLGFGSADISWQYLRSTANVVLPSTQDAKYADYDSIRSWVGRFSDTGSDSLLFYDHRSHEWKLVGTDANRRVVETLVGTTDGFGYLTQGHQFVKGDFDGDGRDELMFHFPSDRNWWLGELSGTNLVWRRVAVSTTVPWRGDEQMTVGDYRGTQRDQVLIYSPEAVDWHVAELGANGLTFTQLTGNSKQFGDLNQGEERVTADFDGDGAAEMLVHLHTQKRWYVARLVQSRLEWTLLAGGPELDPGTATAIAGDFDGDGKADLLAVLEEEMKWAVFEYSAGALRVVAVSTTPEFTEMLQDPILDVGRHRSTRSDSIALMDARRLRTGVLASSALEWRTMLDTRTAGVESVKSAACGPVFRRPWLQITGETVNNFGSYLRVFSDAHTPNNSPAVIVLGPQRTVIPLSSMCFLYVEPLIVVPIVTDGPGLELPIPKGLNLSTYDAQAIVVDNAAPDGLVTSQSPRMRIGQRVLPREEFAATLKAVGTNSTRVTQDLVVELSCAGAGSDLRVARVQFSGDGGKTWSPWTSWDGSARSHDLSTFGGTSGAGWKTVESRVEDHLGRVHTASQSIEYRPAG